MTAHDCSQAAADTLPDYLAADLRLLSVGINPSLRAVREGFYFPNPQNRFWPALNASGLLAAPVVPRFRIDVGILIVRCLRFGDYIK